MICTDKPGERPVLYEFLASRTGLPWSTDFRVIGTMQGVVPVAAVGYNCWVGDGVFMHVAFKDKHSLTAALLREAFMYPFVHCGKKVVYGMTPITNEEAIRFNKKLGFVEMYRTADFVLFQMTFDQCRWVHGRQIRSPASTGLRLSGA